MKNLSKEDVLELIKDFPIKPMFNKVLITLNTLDGDGIIVVDNNMLSDTQFVVAKGSMVNSINEGDRVIIDVKKLTRPVTFESNNQVETVYEADIDAIEIGGVAFAFIEDRVVKAIDNRVEETIKL